MVPIYKIEEQRIVPAWAEFFDIIPARGGHGSLKYRRAFLFYRGGIKMSGDNDAANVAGRSSQPPVTTRPVIGQPTNQVAPIVDNGGESGSAPRTGLPTSVSLNNWDDVIRFLTGRPITLAQFKHEHPDFNETDGLSPHEFQEITSVTDPAFASISVGGHGIVGDGNASLTDIQKWNTDVIARLAQGCGSTSQAVANYLAAGSFNMVDPADLNRGFSQQYHNDSSLYTASGINVSRLVGEHVSNGNTGNNNLQDLACVVLGNILHATFTRGNIPATQTMTEEQLTTFLFTMNFLGQLDNPQNVLTSARGIPRIRGNTTQHMLAWLTKGTTNAVQDPVPAASTSRADGREENITETSDPQYVISQIDEQTRGLTDRVSGEQVMNTYLQALESGTVNATQREGRSAISRSVTIRIDDAGRRRIASAMLTKLRNLHIVGADTIAGCARPDGSLRELRLYNRLWTLVEQHQNWFEDIGAARRDVFGPMIDNLRGLSDAANAPTSDESTTSPSLNDSDRAIILRCRELIVRANANPVSAEGRMFRQFVSVYGEVARTPESNESEAGSGRRGAHPNATALSGVTLRQVNLEDAVPAQAREYYNRIRHILREDNDATHTTYVRYRDRYTIVQSINQNSQVGHGGRLTYVFPFITQTTGPDCKELPPEIPGGTTRPATPTTPAASGPAHPDIRRRPPTDGSSTPPVNASLPHGRAPANPPAHGAAGTTPTGPIRLGRRT